MILPQMSNQIQKKESQIFRLHGLNLSDEYEDGSLCVAENISSRRYPYMTTRKYINQYKVRSLEEFTGIYSIGNFNGLIYVKDNRLYSDGIVMGSVTNSEKQFATINNKLVIMPDKVYISSEKGSARQTFSLEEENTIGEVAFGVNDKGNYIGFTTGDFTEEQLRSYMIYGTRLKISGTGLISTDNKYYDGSYIVVGSNISTGAIYLSREDNIVFDSKRARNVNIKKDIPKFDYICSSDNRIYGCTSSDQTIWASALGDPATYYDYSGESTDSYAVAVGSEGKFTGCCKYGNSVLFFKEHTIHKLVGDYPANYYLYSYDVEGVESGSFKSLQCINDTLLYLSSKGIMAYNGGTPSKISSSMKKTKYRNGSAGIVDGIYYLSCEQYDSKKDKWIYKFYSYDIEKGILTEISKYHPVQFAVIGNTLYFLDYIDFDNENDDYDDDDLEKFDNSRAVYKLDNDRLDTSDGGIKDELEWTMQFNPFIEHTTYNGRITSFLFNKKRYSKLLMRMEMPDAKSYAKVYVKLDDGEWEEVHTILGGNKGVFDVVIPIGRCDKLELKMAGKGEFAIQALSRIYTVGSDRK